MTMHPDGCGPRPTPARGSAALQALTAAALLLPGLAPPALAQDADATAWQAARYRESRRAIDGAPSTLAPLRADSLVLKQTLALPSDDGLVLGVSQDTWSGATPIASAPATAGGNRPVRAGSVGQLVTVGASPMINGSVLLDARLRPVSVDPVTGRASAAPATVDTLASASPETRRQLDARYTHRLRDGTLSLSGGVSIEHDHRSRHLGLGRRLDFDRQLGTLSLGLSHTRSETAAVLDHDAAPYITRTAFADRIRNVGGRLVVDGRRQEWSASAGISRVLGPSAVIEGQLGHTRSAGDLSNAYKLTSVLFAPGAATAGPDDLVPADLRALMEQRPSLRRQWSLSGKLVMHHERSDGALHLGYSHSRDDWGIAAHRVELEWFQPLTAGWMLSPRLRWYTQGAARFYAPWLVSPQAWRTVRIGNDGQAVVTPFDPALLPAHFSSDRRLSAFGSLGLGLGVSKTLGRGVSLDLGLDFTRQSAALRAGGGRGEDTAAELRHTLINASLRFELDTSAVPAGQAHAGHAAAPGAAGYVVPAGVTAAQAMDSPGSVMVAYRQEQRRQGGALLQGARRVDDTELAARACAPVACLGRPDAMQMRMQMLELMLGLDDPLSLMLMAQYHSMQMDTRLLPGASVVDETLHFGRHQSGGLGDTQAYGLVKLHDDGAQRWVLALGLSMPTGNAALRHRRSHQQDGRSMDYGMQLGSGTWDLLPRLSWLAQQGRWSWGAQLGGTLRLQQRNSEGYALGNAWQATAWVARRMSPHWVASLRGALQQEGGLEGSRNGLTAASTPPDLAANHGHRSSEWGIGLQLDGLGGGLRGSELGMELLLPGRSTVRGYQLERRGGLALSWSQHF